MAGVVAVKQLDGFCRCEFLFFTRQRFNDIPLRNGTVSKLCVMEVHRVRSGQESQAAKLAFQVHFLSSCTTTAPTTPDRRHLCHQHPLALARTEYDDRQPILHTLSTSPASTPTLNPAPTPQSRSKELINVKLLFNGNSSVGKISLLLRFSAKQWLPEDVASASRDDWG